MDRKILFWNEGARRNYGYTADEIVGKAEDILHTPEDRASGAVDQLIETANDKGTCGGRVRARAEGWHAIPGPDRCHSSRRRRGQPDRLSGHQQRHLGKAAC